MNKRNTNRKTRRLEVKVILNEKIYTAFTSNLSEGGLFVRTMKGYSPGTVLDLELYLPSGETIKLRGTVKWGVKTPSPQIKNGMGIELIDIPPKYIEFFKSF